MFRWDAYTNIGIENIKITSDWQSKQMDYIHHERAGLVNKEIMNYGWQAIYMQDTKCSWVSNVEFNGVSVGIKLDYTKTSIVNNVKFTGAAGHTGITSRRGTGNLFRDNVDSTKPGNGCEDIKKYDYGNTDCNIYGGMYHTFGVAYYDSTSVFLRSITPRASRIDAHGGEPRATLFDGHVGGHLAQFGGGDSAMPHHASDLTIWNMKYSGYVPYSTSKYSNYRYQFWAAPNGAGFSGSKSHWVQDPSIHGVCTTDRAVSFDSLDFGVDRFSGCAAEGLSDNADYQGVHPESLYEAQCALRNLPSIAKNPAADGLYGPWSEWGECDYQEGVRHRERSIVRYAQSGGRNPQGANSESKVCADVQQIIGEWTSWGSWTTCNGECGSGQVGIKERVRKCMVPPNADPNGIVECPSTVDMGSFAQRETDSQSCTTQPCGVCDCGRWVPSEQCIDGLRTYTRSACEAGQPQVLTAYKLDGEETGYCVAPKGKTLEVVRCWPFTINMNVDVSSNRVRFGHKNWCADLGDDASYLGRPVQIHNCAAVEPDSSLGLKIATIQLDTALPRTSLWGYRMSSTEPLCMGVVMDNNGSFYVATVLCFEPDAEEDTLEVPAGHAVVSRHLGPMDQTLNQNLGAKCKRYPTVKTALC